MSDRPQRYRNVLQRRPWGVWVVRRWWSDLVLWWERQKLGFAISSAVRKIPIDIELREIGRSDRDWYCRLSRMDSGEQFLDVRFDPYVAIRGATLNAQFGIKEGDHLPRRRRNVDPAMEAGEQESEVG